MQPLIVAVEGWMRDFPDAKGLPEGAMSLLRGKSCLNPKRKQRLGARALAQRR